MAQFELKKCRSVSPCRVVVAHCRGSCGGREHAGGSERGEDRVTDDERAEVYDKTSEAMNFISIYQ